MIKSNKEAFKGLEISNDQQFCSKYQQNFFVIKLDFSTLGSASSIQQVKKKLATVMLRVFGQFLGVCGENRLFQETLKVLLKFNSDISDHGSTLEDCLDTLVYCIRSSAEAKNTRTTKKLPQKIALLIDEFDKPYVAALNKGEKFYDEFDAFMSCFLAGIKKNFFDSVFLTGIQSLAFDEGSDYLNSVEVYSTFEAPFCHYYGFTSNNMDQILNETGLTKYKEGFRKRYNGYQSKSEGNDQLILSTCNPYSVMKSIKRRRFGRW